MCVCVCVCIHSCHTYTKCVCGQGRGGCVCVCVCARACMYAFIHTCMLVSVHKTLSDVYHWVSFEVSHIIHQYFRIQLLPLDPQKGGEFHKVKAIWTIKNRKCVGLKGGGGREREKGDLNSKYYQCSSRLTLPPPKKKNSHTRLSGLTCGTGPAESWIPLWSDRMTRKQWTWRVAPVEEDPARVKTRGGREETWLLLLAHYLPLFPCSSTLTPDMAASESKPRPPFQQCYVHFPDHLPSHYKQARSYPARHCYQKRFFCWFRGYRDDSGRAKSLGAP